MGEVILRDLFARPGSGRSPSTPRARRAGRSAARWTVARSPSCDGAGTSGRATSPGSSSPAWLAETDLVLAADAGHASVLRRWARTKEDAAKVRLLREFDPAAVAAGTLEVDDPWYGDEEDFVRCFTEVEAACRGVVAWVTDRLRSAH